MRNLAKRLPWAPPSNHGRAPALVALTLALAVGGAASDARADERRDRTTITSDGTIDTSRIRAHLDVELAGIDAPRWPANVDVARTSKGWNVHVVFPDGSEDRGIEASHAEGGATARILALVIAETVRNHRARAPEGPSTSDAAAPEDASSTHGAATERPSTKTGATANAAPAARTNATGHARTDAPAGETSSGGSAVGSDRVSSFAFGVDGAFGLRAFDPAGTLALEPRLVARLEHASRLGAEVHAFYIRSRTDDALGTAKLDGFGGSVAVSYGFASWRTVRLRAGPRLDVAALRGSGEASSSENREGSVVAPFVAAAGEIVLRARLVGRTSIVFAADAGYVMQGLDLRADERRPIVVKGLTVGGRLGLGFE